MASAIGWRVGSYIPLCLFMRYFYFLSLALRFKHVEANKFIVRSLYVVYLAVFVICYLITVDETAPSDRIACFIFYWQTSIPRPAIFILTDKHFLIKNPADAIPWFTITVNGLLDYFALAVLDNPSPIS